MKITVTKRAEINGKEVEYKIDYEGDFWTDFPDAKFLPLQSLEKFIEVFVVSIKKTHQYTESQNATNPTNE